MTQNNHKIRIKHMLDAAQKAVSYIDGKKLDDLYKDEKLSLALVRLLEIIGEVAKGIGQEARDKYPQVPWKEISGTRDRLIHAYFDVDLNIVWQIISNDLPKLISNLKDIDTQIS